MSNLEIVMVPKELYYHEVKYVRGLEAEIERLRAACGETGQRMARVDASLAKQLSTAMAENARLTAEVQRLRAALEDAVDTLEAMDLHVDNPLYARLRDALEQS